MNRRHIKLAIDPMQLLVFGKSIMEKTKSFTELLVWQKAHKLTLEVYRLTKDFPKEEIYGITSQIRRASISISANIAEGYKRATRKDKARFLNISEGSLEEVRYFSILAKDLGILMENKILIKSIDEIAKLIYSYKRAILNSNY